MQFVRAANKPNCNLKVSSKRLYPYELLEERVVKVVVPWELILSQYLPKLHFLCLSHWLVQSWFAMSRSRLLLHSAFQRFGTTCVFVYGHELQIQTLF